MTHGAYPKTQSGLFTLYINGASNGLAISGIGLVIIELKALEAITDIVPGQVYCNRRPTIFSAMGPVSGLYIWLLNNQIQAANSPINFYTHVFFNPASTISRC